MAFVTDTFTDTEGTTLASHTGETGATWTKKTGTGSGTAEIASNRVRATDGTASGYYTSGTPAAAEYDVQAKFIMRSDDGSSRPGIAGRMTADNVDTSYHARYTTVDNRWELYKIVNNSVTSLGTYSQVLTVDQEYLGKLEIRDAAKKLFVDGVERISNADNAITGAGRAGVRFFGTATDTTGVHLDDFDASDPVVGGGSTNVSLGIGAVTVIGKQLVDDTRTILATGQIKINDRTIQVSHAAALSSGQILITGKQLQSNQVQIANLSTGRLLINGQPIESSVVVNDIIKNLTSGSLVISGKALQLLIEDLVQFQSLGFGLINIVGGQFSINVTGRGKSAASRLRLGDYTPADFSNTFITPATPQQLKWAIKRNVHSLETVAKELQELQQEISRVQKQEEVLRLQVELKTTQKQQRELEKRIQNLRMQTLMIEDEEIILVLLS